VGSFRPPGALYCRECGVRNFLSQKLGCPNEIVLTLLYCFRF
jgi:hypothetical protein